MFVIPPNPSLIVANNTIGLRCSSLLREVVVVEFFLLLLGKNVVIYLFSL